MDGYPSALDLWDVMIEVLNSSNNVPPTKRSLSCGKRHEEGGRDVDQLSDQEGGRHVKERARSELQRRFNDGETEANASGEGDTH